MRVRQLLAIVLMVAPTGWAMSNCSSSATGSSHASPNVDDAQDIGQPTGDSGEGAEVDLDGPGCGLFCDTGYCTLPSPWIQSLTVADGSSPDADGGFSCWSNTCSLANEMCFYSWTGLAPIPPPPNVAVCVQIPNDCSTTPTCDCVLPQGTCGCGCSQADGGGAMFVSCSLGGH
jgi:hypothetical protein